MLGMEHLRPSLPTQSSMTEETYVALSQEQYVKLFDEEISKYGIHVPKVYHNEPPALLYKNALLYEKFTELTSTGALCCKSGSKTGRSPADKRTVEEPNLPVWWGSVNIPICEHSYLVNRERAIDYLNLQDRIYITDGYAGWDPRYRINIRVISSRAYHALFMTNMLVPLEPSDAPFVPDFIIYNAGAFPSNRFTKGVTSGTSICLHYGRGEMVILGSEYAGEMKKGILTLIMYKMPLIQTLPLHSSCNVGPEGDVTLFFGLSGTGKTTLSADSDRRLIGDDEHVWTDEGVFNVEGGCYAKCKNLTEESEPEIYRAIRFGSLLENVVIDSNSNVDYFDCSITENTRCAYPLTHITGSIIPAYINTHPNNIIFLFLIIYTCDAFGVLPPLSLLDNAQAIYHFVSGYTSKVVGTEMGVSEPTCTFSACYGGPFLALHPFVYAALLEKKLRRHGSKVWLVNTGWCGGEYGSSTGRRIALEYTRNIVRAIQKGTVEMSDQRTDYFNLRLVASVPGVPQKLLNPKLMWEDQAAFENNLLMLSKAFVDNLSTHLADAPNDPSVNEAIQLAISVQPTI